MPVTHVFVNPKSDGGDTTIVRPSDWNAAHAVDTLTLVGGTVTVSTPVLNATQTWNAGAVAFTGMALNVTSTASAAGSLLMDLQVGSGSMFSVDKAGSVLLGGGVSCPLLFIGDGGSLAVARKDSTFPRAGMGVITSSATAGVITVLTDGKIGFSTNASNLSSFGAYFSSPATNTIEQLFGTSAQTFRVYNTYTDASNFERAMFDWTTTSNTLTIGAEKLGSGTLRNVKLVGADILVKGDTATPAGGSTAARLLFGTTAGFGIYYGSGAPTVSAASGSIYIRTDNAGASLRLYSNTTGSTTWAAITSA